MKQFIPFDDAWLEHPESMPERLVPYQAGMTCRHAMAEDAQRTGPIFPSREKLSPVLIPS